MNDELASAIVDELHALNLNMQEIIKLLKVRNVNTSSNGEITDAEFEALMEMHQNKKQEEHAQKVDERIEREMKFKEQNEKFDGILRNLGIM